MSEKGLEPLANLGETLWLLAVLEDYVQVTGEYFCLKGTTHTHIHSSFATLQSATHGAQIRGWTVFLVFLAG